jgi:iron complex transport system substrate-binding protein
LRIEGGTLRSRKLMVAVACLVVMLGASVWAADVEVTDQTGATVVISQPVERIASVYGMATYYVYALGAGDRLVAAWYIGIKGISQASDAMFRLEPRLEEILSFGDPNVEELASRGVDLVLADASQHAAFAEQMADIGVPVIQYRVETPDELRAAMALTGYALGGDARRLSAQYTYDHVRIFGTVAADVAGIPDSERLRVLFVGTSPLSIASGEMYQSLLIEAAGGVSVSSDLVGYWNSVNLEQILVWNPDVIVMAPYGNVQPDDLLTNPDWQSVKAVQDGRVYRMPRVIAPNDTPVPESLLGLLWLENLLYPDRVSLDFPAEVEHFYSTYYGYTLNDDELSQLTGP